MNRLCNHRNMKDEGFAKPIDGYIINIDRVENKTNIINYRNYGCFMSEKELKQNTELVEFIMLYLAKQNDLTTTKNISSGKFNSLEKNSLKIIEL